MITETNKQQQKISGYDLWSPLTITTRCPRVSRSGQSLPFAASVGYSCPHTASTYYDAAPDISPILRAVHDIQDHLYLSTIKQGPWYNDCSFGESPGLTEVFSAQTMSSILYL